MAEDRREALLGLWDRLEARGAVVRRVDLDAAPEYLIAQLYEEAAQRMAAIIEGERSGWRPA